MSREESYMVPDENEPTIPDGHGNQVNQRWQQIIEEKENDFWQKNGRDPGDDDYIGIEDEAQELYNNGYQPAKPSPLQDAQLAAERQKYYEQDRKEALYKQIAQKHGDFAASNRMRLDSEIDEDVAHIKGKAEANSKPYHIDVKSKTQNGKRTWSINQVYDK